MKIADRIDLEIAFGGGFTFTCAAERSRGAADTGVEMSAQMRTSLQAYSNLSATKYTFKHNTPLPHTTLTCSLSFQIKTTSHFHLHSSYT